MQKLTIKSLILLILYFTPIAGFSSVDAGSGQLTYPTRLFMLSALITQKVFQKPKLLDNTETSSSENKIYAISNNTLIVSGQSPVPLPQTHCQAIRYADGEEVSQCSGKSSHFAAVEFSAIDGFTTQLKTFSDQSVLLYYASLPSPLLTHESDEPQDWINYLSAQSQKQQAIEAKASARLDLLRIKNTEDDVGNRYLMLEKMDGINRQDRQLSESLQQSYNDDSGQASPRRFDLEAAVNVNVDDRLLLVDRSLCFANDSEACESIKSGILSFGNNPPSGGSSSDSDDLNDESSQNQRASANERNAQGSEVLSVDQRIMAGEKKIVVHDNVVGKTLFFGTKYNADGTMEHGALHHPEHPSSGGRGNSGWENSKITISGRANNNIFGGGTVVIGELHTHHSNSRENGSSSSADTAETAETRRYIEQANRAAEEAMKGSGQLSSGLPGYGGEYYNAGQYNNPPSQKINLIGVTGSGNIFGHENLVLNTDSQGVKRRRILPASDGSKSDMEFNIKHCKLTNTTFYSGTESSRSYNVEDTRLNGLTRFDGLNDVPDSDSGTQ